MRNRPSGPLVASGVARSSVSRKAVRRVAPATGWPSGPTTRPGTVAITPGSSSGGAATRATGGDRATGGLGGFSPSAPPRATIPPTETRAANTQRDHRGRLQLGREHGPDHVAASAATAEVVPLPRGAARMVAVSNASGTTAAGAFCARAAASTPAGTTTPRRVSRSRKLPGPVRGGRGRSPRSSRAARRPGRGSALPGRRAPREAAADRAAGDLGMEQTAKPLVRSTCARFTAAIRN